ncbi:MAG: U32 family peptidase, partial [Betaproteobacteria bacterium HGW-Betaproteobacteria-15]
RVRNNSFRDEVALGAGIEYAHSRGKQFFVVSNIFPHNSKLKTYLADMAPVVALKPDALIMADPGLIDMIRETWPDMPIHLSVQANTVNYAAVRFWKKLGIRRVILSRELSLDQVAEIRQECPDMELEVFVHGALCIAYSGRCLLSGYFNHRDPNQGTCTNACRWEYKTQAATTDTDTGEAVPLAQLDGFNFAQEDEEAASAFSTVGNGQRHPEANKVWLIEEAGRPGELMPIMEDEHGTYIMNSKDLRAVEHVGKLTALGIDSLKIEGRTKSHYYVARTAQVYRRAIDDAVAGKPFNPELLLELEGLSNRGYTGGLMERRPAQDYQNYITGHSASQRSQFVGEVLQVREDGWTEVEAKNRFAVGDRLEVIHPSGNRVVQLDAMRNQDGAAIEVAQGSPIRVWVPLGAPTEGALIARLI